MILRVAIRAPVLADAIFCFVSLTSAVYLFGSSSAGTFIPAEPDFDRMRHYAHPRVYQDAIEGQLPPSNQRGRNLASFMLDLASKHAGMKHKGKDSDHDKKMPKNKKVVTKPTITTVLDKDPSNKKDKGGKDDDYSEELLVTHPHGYLKKISAGDEGVLDDQNRHLPPMKDEDVETWFKLHEKLWTHPPTIIYNIKDGHKIAMFTKTKPEKKRRKKKKKNSRRNEHNEPAAG